MGGIRGAPLEQPTDYYGRESEEKSNKNPLGRANIPNPLRGRKIRNRKGKRTCSDYFLRGVSWNPRTNSNKNPKGFPVPGIYKGKFTKEGDKHKNPG